MRLFGFDIARRREEKAAVPVGGFDRGWWPVVRESFPGAWQKNVEVDRASVLSHHAGFACMTLIASDVAKLRVKLVRRDGPSADKAIWVEAENPAYSPVLRKPNRYQTRNRFWESWILSKLSRGNAYVLKERDDRNVVTGLYVLDPSRVTPLVGEDGSVFYQLAADNLSGVRSEVTVPASEIIHDRWNCLFHPLVGLSPIYAYGLAATHGLAIQNNATRFFRNASRPSGLLVTPGPLTKEQIELYSEAWKQNYGGDNLGNIAVLGNGLDFKGLTMTAVDAQLIEQARWSAEIVAHVFHVPLYKIGLGPMPTNNNVQALNVEYYSTCLQTLLEDAESALDEGLGIGDGVGPRPFYGIEFDIDNLLRMDSVTQMSVLKEGVGAAIFSPDEARARVGLPPVPGGASPYLQQQNYSLEALAKRDAQADPFGKPAQPPQQVQPPAGASGANDNAAAAFAAQANAALAEVYKGLGT